MGGPTGEINRLEGCVNDLTRVLALPAAWVGRDASRVVKVLLDTLFSMLRLEFAYARMGEVDGEPPLEIVRAGASGGAVAGPRAVGSALAGCLEWRGTDHAGARMPNPVGDGEVSIVRLGLGIEGEACVLVAGSRRDDFPSNTEVLLLRVAANQAEMGLRAARLLGEHRRERYLVDEDRRALAALVEHSSDFIAIATLEGRVFFLNPAGQRLVGIRAEEQVRATRISDYITKDDREWFEASVMPTVLREGSWQGEARFRHFHSGAAIPVLQDIFIIKNQSRDRPLSVATIGRDITDRIRAEQSVRESERRLRLQAEAIPHQIWTSLPDGTVDYCNRSFIDYTGLTVEAVQRFGLTAVVHPGDVERVTSAWKEARARLAPYEVEKRLRGVDGRYRRFLSRAVPVCDEQGRLLHWIGTYTDVEDRKQAEDALRDAQAALGHVSRLTTMGELAATLAHELNQPLTAVVANGGACLRWLDRAQPDIAEAMGAVRRMIRDANRAADVVGHARALVKRSTGEKTGLDLDEVIREIITLTQGELLRHRVVLREVLDRNVPPVLGDRIQLQQVLLNLVMNAIEAMADIEECRELTIRSAPKEFDGGPGALVAVHDTGAGIAPENLDRLFDAFYTTKADGLGLGLSISRTIIEGHGGRLWATTNAGPGTTFQFALPASGRKPS